MFQLLSQARPDGPAEQSSCWLYAAQSISADRLASAVLPRTPVSELEEMRSRQLEPSVNISHDQDTPGMDEHPLSALVTDCKSLTGITSYVRFVVVTAVTKKNAVF
jgi:hypothetical protein